MDFNDPLIALNILSFLTSIGHANLCPQTVLSKIDAIVHAAIATVESSKVKIHVSVCEFRDICCDDFNIYKLHEHQELLDTLFDIAGVEKITVLTALTVLFLLDVESDSDRDRVRERMFVDSDDDIEIDDEMRPLLIGDRLSLMYRILFDEGDCSNSTSDIEALLRLSYKEHEDLDVIKAIESKAEEPDF